MAFALIGSTGLCGANTTDTTGSINASGADLGVISIAGYIGFDTWVVTDSNGNTWTQRVHGVTGDNHANDLWDCQGTFSNGMTVTVNGAHGNSTYFAAAVQFFSGSQVSAWGGSSNAAVGAGTTGSPGAITPSAANSLIVTGIALADSQTFGGAGAINSGFTIDAQYDGSVPRSVGFAHLIQGAAASVTPGWSGLSFSGSQNVSDIGYWLASTGGGGGGARPNRLPMMGVS